MSIIEKMDPELEEPLKAFLTLFEGGIDLHDIPKTRRLSDQMGVMAKAMMPSLTTVTSEDRQVPGPEGAPDVPVRVYWPVERPAKLPALLWIHGGGYVIGSVEGDDLTAQHYADVAQCVVVSVEYRLAPEHPFPAPVEDCYAALKWLAANADDLGVDASRIAIGGASAGGGLAAGLALLARDRGEVNVIFQLLIYPMIDDRNLQQAGEGVPDTHVWSRESNLIGWRSYLGREPGGDDTSPYAAASRATDLSGLPPAYIPVGDMDLFLDEDIEYAQRLLQAGVPTELHIFPGAFHGFEGLGAMAGVGQRMIAERDAILKRALHGSQ